MGADAGRYEVGGGVAGEGVGGAVWVGVGGGHLGEVEARGEGGEHRGADYAGGVADHEGHLGGCDEGGGDDEVAFVFAGGVVEDDDELAVFWGGEMS